MMAEKFWWLLTMSSVAWYATVTVYVAIRGAWDIRRMLHALETSNEHRQPADRQEA